VTNNSPYPGNTRQRITIEGKYEVICAVTKDDIKWPLQIIFGRPIFKIDGAKAFQIRYTD